MEEQRDRGGAEDRLYRDDLAEIWRSAQQRRAEDIRSWLIDLFKKRSRIETVDAETWTSAAG